MRLSMTGVMVLLLMHLPKGKLVEVKDFAYGLDRSQRLYSKQISDNGLKLVVGANWQRNLEHTNQDTILKCHLHTHRRDIDKNSFLPIVQMKKDSNSYEVINSAELLEYFVINRREIWLCSEQEIPHQTKRVSITRFVSELIGRVEVNQVFYHDGVQVTSKAFFGKSRTAVIRETKYFDTYKEEVVKYDGKIEIPEVYESILPKLENVQYQHETVVATQKNIHFQHCCLHPGVSLVGRNIPIPTDRFPPTNYNEMKTAVLKMDLKNPKALHILNSVIREGTRIKSSDGGEFKEVHYSIPRSTQLPFEKRTNRKAAMVVEVGQLANATLGNVSSTAQCEKYQGIQSEYPFKFRTRITLQGLNVSGTLTQNNYTQYFTPIGEEVWFCKDYDQNQFWRVVNEFASIHIKLGALRYYDEVTDLSVFSVQNKEMVRAKVIAYHTYKNIDQQIIYLGNINLTSSEKGKEPQVLKSSSDAKDGVARREIEYLLKPGRTFRSMISMRGLSIRVGSQWSKTIGTKNDVVKCCLIPSKNIYSLDYETKFRLVLKNDFRYYLKAVPRSEHSRYWHFIRQQVWSCQKTDTTQTYRFLRIVNELKGKVALYEVEYNDNIQLYSRIIEESRKSVNLVEIKYMDETNFQIYKYEGKVLLESTVTSSKSFIDCLNCEGQLIRKTENEIMFERGVFKNRYIDEDRIEREAIVYTCPVGGSFTKPWMNDAKKRSIIVGVDPAHLTSVGSREDTVECDDIDERRNEFHSYIEINKFYNPESFKFLPIVDRENVLKLRWIQQQVWLCTMIRTEFNAEAEKYQLYRIYNHYRIYEKLNEYKIRDGINATIYNKVYEEAYLIIQETKYLMTDFGGAKYEGTAIIDPKETNNRVTSGTLGFAPKQLSAIEKQQNNEFDISYELEKRRVHRVTVSPEGHKIVELGKIWTEQYKSTDNKQDSVYCDRNNGILPQTYDQLYKTHCRSVGPERHGEYSSQLFDKYFVLKNWEIWNCKNETGALVFHRVVNDFELKAPDAAKQYKLKSIKEIHYQDGITVYRGERLLGGRHGWYFHEIRYVLPENPQLTYKYAHNVILNRDHIDAQMAGEFEHSDVHTCFLNLAERSMSYQLENDSKMLKMSLEPNVHDSNMGIALKIGKIFYEKVIEDGRTFSCGEIFKAGYESQFGMVIETAYEKKPFFSWSVTKYENLTQHVWECTPIDESSSTSSVKLIRVKNRVRISRGAYPEKVQQILFYDGITFSADLQYIDEIKYYDDSDKKLIKFDGFVILDKLHDLDRQDPKKFMRHREIDYVLDIPLIYATNKLRNDLKSTGIVIQIEQAWRGGTAAADYSAECFMSIEQPITNLAMTKTLFKTVKGTQFKDLEYTGDYDDGFFTFSQKSRAFKCSSPQIGDFRKVKVVTELRIESAQVFHPDGVTVTTNYNTHNKLVISEVKYMNTTSSEVIKFEGKVKHVYNPDKYNEGSSKEQEKESGCCCFPWLKWTWRREKATPKK